MGGRRDQFCSCVLIIYLQLKCLFLFVTPSMVAVESAHDGVLLKASRPNQMSQCHVFCSVHISSLLMAICSDTSNYSNVITLLHS